VSIQNSQKRTFRKTLEGLLPQCNSYGLIQQNVHTEQHKQTKYCQQYTEIKRKRQQEVLQNAAKYVNFYIDNQTTVTKGQTQILANAKRRTTT
jgi:hypothetical protein